MAEFRVLALAVVTGALAFAAAAAAAPAKAPGVVALAAAFEPARLFAGELDANSDDGLVLTAWASARDNYAPAYALAIAYRCDVATRRCGYVARLLRTGATLQAALEPSLKLARLAHDADSGAELRRGLDAAGLDWLEADVDACPKGIFAMDSVRVSDWRPDIHFGLQDPKDREIILHPAVIRVTMAGSYTTSTYEGWVMAADVPAAVRQLLDTLEPCWKPATSPRPWKRR